MRQLTQDNISFNIWGQESNPPLLLVHGFLGTGNDWQGVVESLAQDFFCVAVNLPGASQQDRRHRDRTKVLDVPSVAQEVASAFVALFGKSSRIIAYSMGGRIALSILDRGLIECPAAVFVSTNPGIESEQDRKERRRKDERLAAKISEQGLEMFLESWYRSEVFSSLENYPQRRESMIKTRLASNDPFWVSKVLAEMSPGRMPNYWSVAVESSIPQLWLVGKQDRKYCLILEELERRKSSVSTSVIDKAGHSIHLEQPDDLAAEITEFYRAIASINVTY